MHTHVFSYVHLPSYVQWTMTGHDTTWNKIQLLCGSTGDGDSLAEAESQHSGGDRLRVWRKVDHLRLDSLDLGLEFTWIIMIISFDSLWLFLGCPIGLSIYRWSPLKGLMMRKHHKPHAKWDDPPGMATAWAGTVLEAICHTICHCQPVAPHHERKTSMYVDEDSSIQQPEGVYYTLIIRYSVFIHFHLCAWHVARGASLS